MHMYRISSLNPIIGPGTVQLYYQPAVLFKSTDYREFMIQSRAYSQVVRSKVFSKVTIEEMSMLGWEKIAKIGLYG